MLQPNVFESHPVVVSLPPDQGLLKKDVPINLTMVRPAESEQEAPPDVVAFLGLGNEEKATRRAAEQLAAQGVGPLALVSAFPFWKMAPTPAALTELSIQGSIAVMEEMHAMHGRHPNGGPVPIHAAAESQIGPSLPWGMRRAPELYTGRVALLRALGLQGEMGGGQFFWRSVRTGFQSDQLRNPGFMKVAARAARRVATDALPWGDKGAGLKFALSTDIREPLSEIADQRGAQDLLVVSAADDLLFDPPSQHKSLESIGLESTHWIVPGSHTPPAVAPGAKQFKPIVHWLRTGYIVPDTLVQYDDWAKPKAA